MSKRITNIRRLHTKCMRNDVQRYTFNDKKCREGGMYGRNVDFFRFLVLSYILESFANNPYDKECFKEDVNIHQIIIIIERKSQRTRYKANGMIMIEGNQTCKNPAKTQANKIQECRTRFYECGGISS